MKNIAFEKRRRKENVDAHMHKARCRLRQVYNCMAFY